jgi:hypothetical protein
VLVASSVGNLLVDADRPARNERYSVDPPGVRVAAVVAESVGGLSVEQQVEVFVGGDGVDVGSGRIVLPCGDELSQPGIGDDRASDYGHHLTRANRFRRNKTLTVGRGVAHFHSSMQPAFRR